jgi:protein-L-isoaspartate(D-aspartate) O-methyltransferase
MAANPESDAFAATRHEMVDTQLRARGIRDEGVLAAMERVPRHLFAPSYNAEAAYEDHPVLIGQNQTISQPYMVAAMSQAAEVKPTDRVLEVGTGSGYQAAVLAELAAQVFTIERFATLAESAQRNLANLNYQNIIFTVGDGTNGIPQYSPYDAIIVTAAGPRIPPALVEQLREGGRLVIPVGNSEEQELHLVRMREGVPSVQHLFGCKFVPLIGRYGFHPAT